MSRFETVIIGSGLGGLLTGTILAKEGKQVCVLEKEAVAGGCLRSFRRGGELFDTGMHYMGCMDDGQMLNQILRYCGVYDSLRLRRLDEEFDVVHLKEGEFSFSQGYDRFAETLAAAFPGQRASIRNYTAALRRVGESIGVEKLRQGILSKEGLQYMSMRASEQIEQLIGDDLLRKVVTSTSMLYDYRPDSTPFYVHAMINHSFIEGAYRFIDGSQQLADALCAAICRTGGEVRCRAKVTAINRLDDCLKGVRLADGEVIEAHEIVSDIHPRQLLSLLDPAIRIRPSFRDRIVAAQNSTGMFSVFATVDRKAFPYLNQNHYLIPNEAPAQKSPSTTPQSVLLAMQPRSVGSDREALTLLAPMSFDRVAQWSDTRSGKRGDDYLAFKQQRAEEVIGVVENYFPGFSAAIKSVETATPLTYRDYTASFEGSAYGMLIDCRSVLETLLAPATKIEGLYLTGQNVAVHGALGVAMTALSTCGAMLGTDYVARKIGNF